MGKKNRVWRVFLGGVILAINMSSYAVIPSSVYRLDGRSPDYVFQNGISPWSSQNPNINLIAHVSGRSLDDRTSGLVSVSGYIESIRRMASELITQDGEFSYLYVIRPTESYYDVTATLRYIQMAYTGDVLGTQALELDREFGWQEEFVIPGVIQSSTIRYAQLVSMVDGQLVYSPEINNPNYVDGPPSVNPDFYNSVYAVNADDDLYAIGEWFDLPVSLSVSPDDPCEDVKEKNTGEVKSEICSKISFNKLHGLMIRRFISSQK